MTNEPPAGPAAEFLARVRAAAEGTPYAVTPTPNGFDVGIDLTHFRWVGGFRNRRRVCIHRVRLDERAQRFSIRDDLYRLSWPDGMPKLTLGTFESGRVRRKYWQYTFGQDGVQGTETYDTEEGRRLITDAAKELGWQGSRSGAERFALAMGVIGGAVGLVVCLGLLIAFLG
ncbi:hypothetical protein [Pseudonocardia acaciae]|uniref:hypothetical protein n=1 Tax=Pseudonocardia acaciae TaxID=551276 RepID=UPI0004905278|nr:hypothetical protein [Pseudonocardia acaciae]